MAAPVWEPEDRKPAEAAALDEAIARAGPGADVKLTLVDGVWRVRALRPAALCARGGTFAERDVSRRVADALREEGLAADVFPLRGIPPATT